MNERDEAGYKDFLENKVAQLEAQVKALQEQIKQLKQEKGISSASDGMTFNPRTGTHVEQSTSKHFCTVCLAKDQRWELKIEPHGWRCVICRKYYSDPDRPEGPIEYAPSEFP